MREVICFLHQAVVEQLESALVDDELEAMARLEYESKKSPFGRLTGISGSLNLWQKRHVPRSTLYMCVMKRGWNTGAGKLMCP